MKQLMTHKNITLFDTIIDNFNEKRFEHMDYMSASQERIIGTFAKFLDHQSHAFHTFTSKNIKMNYRNTAFTLFAWANRCRNDFLEMHASNEIIINQMLAPVFEFVNLLQHEHTQSNKHDLDFANLNQHALNA